MRDLFRPFIFWIRRREEEHMAGRPMAQPRPNKDADVVTTIRITEGLRQQIARHAKRNERTFGAEVRVLLQASLKATKSTQLVE